MKIYDQKWYRDWHVVIWITLGFSIMFLSINIQSYFNFYINDLFTETTPKVKCDVYQKWYEDNHLNSDWSQQDQDSYEYLIKYSCEK